MHALNAYFGGPKLDRAQFEAEIREHDVRQQARGLAGLSANDVDATSGDQKNILAHVLAKYGIFARMYELRDRTAAIAKAESYGAALIYSPDHVWVGRRDTCGNWVKIDSLSGISHMNLSDLENISLGIIVPCLRLDTEFVEIAAELNKLVEPDIVDYVVREMKLGHVLGGAETLIGAAVSILEIQLCGRASYPAVHELLTWYDQFIRTWSGSNCTSIKFVLTHVPRMILRVLQIKRVMMHIS